MATRMLYDTVDAIWRGAGDTATDWNFYTKRGLLAAVYSATVLYWLQDESAGYEETWRFLDRRIADAMRVPKFVEALGSRINPLCSGRRYGS
jgi:ubiquinone biosynthesis protein COQ9